MKESREEYMSQVTREITDKLQLDMNKEYSVDEINELLDRHNMRGGILQFVPTEPYKAHEIIDTLVYMDMQVTDSVHEVMGTYENKIKCEYCNGYFDREKGNIFQIISQKGSPVLCKKCRREHKIKIEYWHFIECIPDEEKEKFADEELKHGIDYSDYIKKFSRT